MEKQPRKRDTLALPSGEPATAFSDPGHKAVGHGTYKITALGILYGL